MNLKILNRNFFKKVFINGNIFFIFLVTTDYVFVKAASVLDIFLVEQTYSHTYASLNAKKTEGNTKY